MTAAQECLSTGRPLLIEDVEEELDPVLDPVLEGRVIKRGRTAIVVLGDKEVILRIVLTMILTCFLRAHPLLFRGEGRFDRGLSVVLHDTEAQASLFAGTQR